MSESATLNRETLGFQTEVKQLLHLMIHSLYSNKAECRLRNQDAHSLKIQEVSDLYRTIKRIGITQIDQRIGVRFFK